MQISSCPSLEDGNIQVHEFISWITGRQASFSPLLHLGEDGSGKIEFAVGNPTKHTMKYIFKFHMCENVECYQNPVEAGHFGVVGGRVWGVIF